MATTKPTINIDGSFSDWIASERIDYGDVAGYSLYGVAQGGYLYFDLNAPAGVTIGPNTTIWLNTDLNTTTGFNIFGDPKAVVGGAEYNVNIKADGTAALYTGGAGGTLVLDNIPIAYSTGHTQVELAIPLASMGNPNNPVDVLYDVNNSIFGPTSYSNQPYVAPNAEVTRTPTHKVAIIYSDTTAANYFRGLGDAAGAPSTAYDDLFMAAQNQARMAGVSYDIIDESQLTNVNNLIGYDALIFPAMTDVNTAQLPAIMSALSSAVYDYHIGIITSGDFLTNDQTGAALPGNPYVNMETLLGLNRVSGGNSGNVTVTAADVSNPIMKSYTAGQVIQNYTGVGYTDYAPVGNTPADVLVNQNVAGVGTLPGVTETTVGGATNVHFASQALLGDSNLLSDAIQTVVLGTTPGVALHTSRDAGIVAVRMDMDQAQVPADVSPVGGGPGIYNVLIPILQQWKAQYDFVGSYYVDIGDNPNPTNPTTTDPTTTNWATSLPFYQQILATGGEIGTHSYTHLINPPTTTFTAITATNPLTAGGDWPLGSTTITLDHVPSFYGITVGMWLTGTGIGSNTQLPGSAGEGGAVANTQVIGVSGNTITVSYIPAGFGGTNKGTIGDIPAGTTLTFSVPPENTNFLEPVTVPGATDPLSSDGKPFTYAYEFGTSTTTLEQELTKQLGHPVTIYGAAVPGAAETAATSQNILTLFPSGTGYTGYVTGGWTGIDSGYPSAFGYIDPTHQNSVYIAPNMTFDFTEIQYEGKSVATAEADWAAQFSALTANAAGTPVVVLPIHDYGAAAWNTTTDTANNPLTNPNYYTTQMYTDFIANAAAKNYEFVTLEDLASRIAAQEKAHIDYTTVGNTISATVTPDPTAPDLGAMALDVVNDGTSVIQNVANWYAYNAQELFLPANGGSFTINLGTTQDDVTHITALPMRGDLLSVTGDGLNLNFSMLGEGDVIIDLGAHWNTTPAVTGATVKSLVGDLLDLSLTGLGKHDVSLSIPAVTTGTGSDTLILSLSEDAYLGDAQFTVSVDGKQLGGTFTTTASHAAGASQAFAFKGDFAIGAHNVTVNFLNDAWAGTAATDRNLYVNAITYDGTSTGQGAALMSAGPKSFTVTDTTAVPNPPAVTTGSGSDTLVLSIAEDEYLGDAQFTVSVDGKQLGGTFTTTASHAAGASQAFTFKGDWAIGAHNVTVNFLNDAWAGTAATDRNLYVNAITYDGTNTGQSAALMSAGPKSFTVTDTTAVPNPPAITTGSGSDTLVLSIAEDEYLGDAQFTVSIDGKQLGGTFTTTASHAAGASQAFTFKGDWAVGAHNVTVSFLNDAWAGTAATDRNLYVNAITYDGTNTGQSAALTSAGPKSFTATDTTAIPAAVTGSGADTLVLSISEDAYQGNAQFTVSVDGKQLGGTFTASALHASGANQNFVFNGDFGSGQHTVTVNFLNDAWAGTAATDRNLYVNAITYNGTNTNQSAALMSQGPRTFAVTGGTTPAVSETSDHGTLQQNLAQTGTYVVGGDTFVLSSGNAATVTLGTGASQIRFVGASSVALTAGAGQAGVTADAGTNTFVTGSGSLDVTGGGGKNAYVFHANSGLLTIEDFALAKGDTLTVDKALQGSFSQASDGQGGTMLSFGTPGHGVDIHGMAALPTGTVVWV